MQQVTRKAAVFSLSSLRTTFRRSLSSSSNTPIDEVFQQVYLSGTHGDGRYERRKLGQPRVVLAVTGGGGQLVSSMLMQPGASSCILEAVVPYSKNSCVDFIERSNRSAEGIGFCSEDMAWRLALSARDRAFELENDLNRWPDAHGVAMTATIVSHYSRRGGYRAHAAAVDARGYGCTYTHSIVKGHRNRSGEDLACALLAARALANSTGIGNNFDNSHGIRLHESENTNTVGEVAEGLEKIPTCESRTDFIDGNYILVGSTEKKICAPKGALPKESIAMWYGSDDNGIQAFIKMAKEALFTLGRQGDGEIGSWAIMPAPIFVVVPKSHAESVHTVLRKDLENVAVVVMESKSSNISSHPNDFVAFAQAYSAATFVLDYNSTTHLIDDGSPSTVGVSGRYVGTVVVDSNHILPHGSGRMVWDNGIAYEGEWTNGVYHGSGVKSYSKGGGYSGGWKLGKRNGLGVSLYGGKWGYDQWEGPFVDDLPHGVGVMKNTKGEKVEFDFCEGEPVIK